MNGFYRSLIWLTISSGVFAGEGEQPSEHDIQALIDQLVSPNPKPIAYDEDRNVGTQYHLPSGFDKEKQKQVRRAYFKLKEIGPPAFPFLVERWEDHRHCLTASNCLSGVCRNVTVGNACRSIMFDQLQPYGIWPTGYDDPRGKPQRPDYPGTYLESVENTRKCCEKTKGKTLLEIQLRILDWVIESESKRPGDYQAEERAELQNIRRELVEDNKPLAHGNYYCWDIEE